MTTVFVYEHLTALGGKDDLRSSLPPSLLREGRAMFDAVHADFQAVAAVRSISCENEYDFRRHAAECDFTLVIAPEFDRILAARSRWVEECGGTLLGPSSIAVEFTADKFELAMHFVDQDLPAPATWLIGKQPKSYPFVWKPRYGAGSQDTFYLQSEAAWLTAQDQVLPEQEMIAQEFIPGRAASVAFLIGPEETQALPPCWQYLSSDGRFHYRGGSTPLPESLAERAVALARRAVASVPGLFGYVGVDLVLGDTAAGDRIIEINPRFTTSYIGLRQLAKFNLADLLLRIVRGNTLPNLSWRTDRIPFFVDGQLGSEGRTRME